MTSNPNPGNFANRPKEEQVAAAIAGGRNEGPGSAAKHQKEAPERVVRGEVGGGGRGRRSGGGGGGGDDDDVVEEDGGGDEEEVYEDEEEGEDANGGGGGGGKSKRGFAAMPRERVQEIARMGGKKGSHAKKCGSTE
ncbi:hypothetical protein CF326_g7529 [Tilletia indica]|nr:hypothetical protein CF326_g7529 [Tilletia indica]